MADTSFFDKFFSADNNPAIQSLKGLPTDALEFLRSLEPDKSLPLTVGDKFKQDIYNIPTTVGQGALGTAEAIDALLNSDSPIVAGLKDGTISEGDVNLDGVDLVQVLGDNLQTDMLPEELKNVGPGQMNRFDPTGAGRIKARPTTMGEFELTGKNLEPYNPIGGLQTIDPELQSEAFGDLEFELEKEKQRKIDAENFRKQEEKLTQGGLNSMTIAESDKINAESKKMTQEQQEEGFLSAMDDFFEGARGAGPEVPKDRTIAEYKKAFSEATGIDTSGKVDKKDALMAFGLALMQNKAGKGLNVGKMLESVGEAGDKALPALEKAKERARQGALAGGKYALQTQSSDKAVRAAANEKMMNRDKYWVYKKGTNDKPFEGFETGQFEDLNKYELDKLVKDPKFQEQYDFISGKDRFEILKTRAEGIDLGDEWTNDLKNVSLIGGKADDLPSALVVAGHPADANYGGTASARYKLGESKDGVVRRFADYQTEIVANEEKLSLLIENIQAGITIPGQLYSKVKQLGKSFGMPVDTSSVASAQQSLANIAIDNVLEILKESGRTISEGERTRVEKRVGDIDMSLAGSDPELVLNQVRYVYNMVVTSPQRDLDNALEGFKENFGYSISGGSNSTLPTEQELEQVNALRKSRGEEPLTMESY